MDWRPSQSYPAYLEAELDKKADLRFTYTPTKTGRRITGWTFKVKKNHPRPTQRQLPLRDREPEGTPEDQAKALAVLADWKPNQGMLSLKRPSERAPPERTPPGA